jgi:L-asparaginase
MGKPRVLLILTGGTITMVQDPVGGVLIPASKPEHLIEAVPHLRKLADLDLRAISNIDSSDLQPELWSEIARVIVETQADYDGYVVTHGTDTLAYTAAALALLIENPKPIICTGAQRPLTGDLISDAQLNLAHAVEAATLDLGEVCVAFGNQLLRGGRAHKQSVFHLEAFTSFGVPALGEFGVRVRLTGGHRRRSDAPIGLRPHAFDNRVAWLPIFPGMNPVILDQLVALGTRGIFLQGYGAGNVPTQSRSLIPNIHAAVDCGVAVVLGTQCRLGGVESLYATGQAAITAGAISAGDMTPEMTVVKLMWALGQTQSLIEIQTLLETSVAGERNTL